MVRTFAPLQLFSRGESPPAPPVATNHSGNIQGTFEEHSGNTQGTFREHPGNTTHFPENVQGTRHTCRGYSRDIHGTQHMCRGKFRGHSGDIQETFTEHPWNVRRISKKHSGNISGTLGEQSGNISIDPTTETRRVGRQGQRMHSNPEQTC